MGGSGGSYVVSRGHTHAGTGFFTVKAHIIDVGGSTADATTTVLIFGSPAGGSFVIGDNSAAPGSTVTIWGAPVVEGQLAERRLGARGLQGLRRFSGDAGSVRHRVVD